MFLLFNVKRLIILSIFIVRSQLLHYNCFVYIVNLQRFVHVFYLNRLFTLFDLNCLFTLLDLNSFFTFFDLNRLFTLFDLNCLFALFVINCLFTFFNLYCFLQKYIFCSTFMNVNNNGKCWTMLCLNFCYFGLFYICSVKYSSNLEN